MLIFREIGSRIEEKIYTNSNIGEFVSKSRDVYYSSDETDIINNLQTLYGIIAAIFLKTKEGTLVSALSALTGTKLSDVKDKAAAMYIRALEIENILLQDEYDAVKCEFTFNEIEIYETDFEEIINTYWESDGEAPVVTAIHGGTGWSIM